MADVYVIDAHALIALQRLNFPSDVGLSDVLYGLTDLVAAGRLCFPTPVVQFCREFATGEPISNWVNAVAGTRVKKNPKSDYQSAALFDCPDIADEDDEEESVGLFVAAMQMEYSETCSAVVVTEDRRPQPTRLCLLDACGVLAIPTVSVAAFLVAELSVLSA